MCLLQDKLVNDVGEGYWKEMSGKEAEILEFALGNGVEKMSSV